MKRILIVDDHELDRAGVMRIVEQPGIVFAEASSADEALRLVRAEDWDLAIMDIPLSEGRGLELLKKLKQIRPRLPVLILSRHSDHEYARRLFMAGVSGYITKDSPRAELVQAVNKVIEGGRYVSPTLAESFVAYLEPRSERPPHEALSHREYEVLTLIASGKKIHDIANLLLLSDKTISTYRARMLRKMRMKTTAELIHYAIRNNLVD
jgi:two-component system, NarL family, invasion response regulator UvrY